jgi:hypothetical protein
MGKTLPPFSQLVEAERRRWMPFKKALPKADQPIFDRLFDCAKLHIQAGVMVSRPWPFETIVMAILLEQEKRIEHLMRQLEQRVPNTE